MEEVLREDDIRTRPDAMTPRQPLLPPAEQRRLASNHLEMQKKPVSENTDSNGTLCKRLLLDFSY
jgi:hypothetical protein